MTKFCKTIVEYMGCPCEVFEDERDYSKIHGRYLELLEKGKSEGYTPLIISVDDIMARNFEESDVELNLDKIKAERKAGIEAAEKLDALKVLSEYAGYEPEYGEFGEDLSDREERFSCASGKETILAQIPTGKPWELAVWAPMGGFNECPLPEEQAAVFRYWYEKHGAVPAAVSRDIWELYVPNPVTDKETAMKLAEEMYNFCHDIVDQGAETIGALAGAITGSHIWFLWWD